MSSELVTALAHAKLLEEAEHVVEETTSSVVDERPYKRAVTHNLEQKLLEAGFTIPRQHIMSPAQKRRRKRDNRSEGETSIRGGSSGPPSSHNEGRKNIMPMHNESHAHGSTSTHGGHVPPVSAPSMSEVSDVMNTVLSRTDYFLDRQIGKFVVESPRRIAVDLAKFTGKTAIAVAGFAACAAIGKAILFRSKGAPTT